MKKIILLIASTTLICGCITQNPPVINVSPSGMATTNAGLYVVSPALTNAPNMVSAVETAAAPLLAAYPIAAPVAALGVTTTNAVLGLLVALSTAFAGYKNNQANTHMDAAAALASAVVANGSQTLALNNSAQNNSTAAVATHLANAGKAV